MRKLNIILLVLALALGACSAFKTRQKLSPQANVNAKTAGVYYAQENVEKAEQFYLLVLEEHPDHVISLRRVADINLHKAENFPGKSVEYNKKAFELYSQALDVYKSFENLTDEERLDIRDMTRRREGAWTRIYRAGDASLEAGDTQKAMEIFELAVELNPARYEPMIRLKDIYQKELKDDAKAEEILLTLIEQDPENLDYIRETGAFYFNQENYAEAVKYFAKAREKAPADVDNLLNLSYAYYELENYSKALEVTQQALALDPGNIDILQNARDVAFMAGEKDLTVKYLKQLIERRSNDTDFADICRILYEQEKYEELITYAQKWYQWNDTNPDPVQFIILGASQTNNDALRETYTKILQSLQNQK
ncbi:MAG: tetratricopeptide repeat protein [Candidatus Cloacimonadaceae bacterium]|jgi:tetratricopeptide (TPR) repeat protein|nr:tetratricopeptide repeat protein [Candidatus Cloacimonadota bacterium]MDY0126620.1 tetratricopeptide repeat protein [Candidatus Cloacimonadaceae bacterium]MCB5255234.1 tetratricopeptide repeat protein [Candidatus Cloacimonadota bacterium]MCK9177456.1 tetratricopeptide repeat protein [Candidatus Cloacimonadota bacterium]MCK9241940.1 tetratricopeptide repeat protein [Candidatus Cloacimonadota bacterium]